MIIDHWTLDIPSWNRWDVHPTVVAGLALLGGLYVYLGGLKSPRRQVARFVGGLAVLSPFSELPRAQHLVQMLYLFLLGIPMSLTGALITLSGAVLYPFYSAAPRVGGLSPLEDQQIGGLLMWVLGGLMLWIVMTVIWFRYSVWDQRSDAETKVPEAAYGARD